MVNLGDLILFLQSTLIRFQVGLPEQLSEYDVDTFCYQLTSTVFNYNGRKLSPYKILSTSVIYSKSELSAEEAAIYSAWFKALFDSGSEGIDDSILRSVFVKHSSSSCG